MTLALRADFNIIGDAVEDFDAWLEARKPLLTSSSIHSYREVNVDSWWSTTRDDVCKQKFLGVETEFDDETITSMAHGTFDEVNIANKLGFALGAEVQCENWLITNPRWPTMGASIDGFIGPPASADVPHPELCQDRAALPNLARQMLTWGAGPFVLEIKKSTSKTWQKKAPHYYSEAQCQQQLQVLDLEFGVIVGECIHERWETNQWGKKYPRKFWDLRAYPVLRDKKWEGIMDELVEQFEEDRIKWSS